MYGCTPDGLYSLKEKYGKVGGDNTEWQVLRWCVVEEVAPVL